MLGGLLAVPPGSEVVDHWSLSGADRRKRPVAVVLVKHLEDQGMLPHLFDTPWATVRAYRVELPRAAWRWPVEGWR